MRGALANVGWILGAQIMLLPIFVSAIFAKAVGAAELEDIRDRGYLLVAVKDDRPPLGFVDETGNLSGFEIDIARRLAAELLDDDTAVRLVPVRNVDRLNAVLEDRVDIAIAAVTLTEPRRRIVSFSDPYYLDGTAFITNRQNIQQLRDLRVGTVALLDRASSVPHVRYILPGAQLVGVNSYTAGQLLLESGAVDAFAGDASVLAGWAQQAAFSEYRLLPSLLSADPLSVVIPKGVQYNPLRSAINQAIRRWYAEGWLQERAAYWGLPAEASQFLDTPAAPPNLSRESVLLSE